MDDDDGNMQQPGSGGSAHPSSSLPEAAALDVPGRPDFVTVIEPREDRPIPATAVRAVTPERERRTTRPESVRVYVHRARRPNPDRPSLGRRIAYAYITPAAGGAAASCKADPGPFIRRAIRAAVPRERFELQGPGGHGSDRTVIFCSPEDREAAMEKQPFFALDDGGAAGAASSVRLVREGETSNVRRFRMDSLAHVALLNYPKEQRNEEDIRRNCSGFGYLLEVDPGCYDDDAPDLSPVRVVLSMEHHREIPREVRIRYGYDFSFRNVVPVQILRLWDRSLSTDADGKYVPMYPAAAGAPAAAGT